MSNTAVTGAGKDSKVSEFKQRSNKLERAADSIRRLAISFGYSKEEAKIMKSTKIAIFGDSESYLASLERRHSIRLGLLLPIGSVMTAYDWFQQDAEERLSALWQAGLDVKEYNYMEDVLCTTTHSGRFCGFCIFGQERTDDEWVNLLVDGKRVASLEAQLANKGDDSLKAELRTLNNGG